MLDQVALIVFLSPEFSALGAVHSASDVAVAVLDVGGIPAVVDVLGLRGSLAVSNVGESAVVVPVVLDVARLAALGRIVFAEALDQLGDLQLVPGTVSVVHEVGELDHASERLQIDHVAQRISD